MKGRNKANGWIKTGLEKALKELEKIEKKGTCTLKVPELRLGCESLGPKTSSSGYSSRIKEISAVSHKSPQGTR